MQGWFTEAAAEIAALPGAGASPVTILLGELVTSILDSFHLNTPALKGAADQTRQPTGFLNLTTKLLKPPFEDVITGLTPTLASDNTAAINGNVHYGT